MAVLSDIDRAMVSAVIQRRVQSGFGGITKPDLLAAVNATDGWIDTNAASFNAALPFPARTSLSTQDKTLVFCYVALQRAGIL